MAKNTGSSTFRKLDVDKYNEELNFREEDIEIPVTFPDEKQVNKLLSQGRNIEALIQVLQNAPLHSRSQQVKDKGLTLTLAVLLSIKPAQMDQAVATVESKDLLDVLMKYIYRGFERPSEASSAHLLQWHEKTFAKGGLGCIMRVLSDTNRA